MLFLPRDLVPALNVPPRAVTDGSPDPVWVSLPAGGRSLFGRGTPIRLPFDAATAERARRWLRLNRIYRMAIVPVQFVALTAALLMQLMDVLFPARSIIMLVAILLPLPFSFGYHRTAVAQFPRRIDRSGFVVPAVHPEVEQEWADANPGVELVEEEPPAKRLFPAWAYAVISALCIVGCVLIWGQALDGNQVSLLWAAAFAALVLGAIVAAFKTLPSGFIRFEDGHR